MLDHPNDQTDNRCRHPDVIDRSIRGIFSMRHAPTAALILIVFAGSASAIPTQSASTTQPQQQNPKQAAPNQAAAIDQPIKHNYVSRPGVLEFTGQMIVRPRQDLYAANNPNPNARASDITAPGARLLAARLAAHARGSAEAMREYLSAISPAMILSHAERLASLVEGTPAYAQCIELIKKDIEDFAMTTPKDAARIVANYPRPR
jgi:hypothetical protein